MTDDDETSDWADYDSGPYCRHWSHPNDCSEVCAKCGHRCDHHDPECYDCDCKEWVEHE